MREHHSRRRTLEEAKMDKKKKMRLENGRGVIYKLCKHRFWKSKALKYMPVSLIVVVLSARAFDAR
jgi:hypothetical protein